MLFSPAFFLFITQSSFRSCIDVFQIKDERELVNGYVQLSVSCLLLRSWVHFFFGGGGATKAVSLVRGLFPSCNSFVSDLSVTP